jgi:hypothetical protein
MWKAMSRKVKKRLNVRDGWPKIAVQYTLMGGELYIHWMWAGKDGEANEWVERYRGGKR